MAITLRAARVNAGLSQLEAAKRLNISEAKLSRWESGKSFPNVRNIIDIEQVYGKPYGEIIFLPKQTDKP